MRYYAHPCGGALIRYRKTRRASSSLFQRGRKSKRHAHVRCLRLLCYTCMGYRHIFPSANVIAQTVLIYIIYVSLYLHVLSSNVCVRARASISDLSVGSAWSAHQSYLIIRSSIYTVRYPLTDKFSCDRVMLSPHAHMYTVSLHHCSICLQKQFFLKSHLSYVETFANIVIRDVTRIVSICLSVFRVNNEISRLWKIPQA